MKISKWDQWQTFRKDRGTPPWIKVYRNLLSNEEWVELSDEEKGQLVSIWLLAADKGGEIPDSPKTIQRMAMLDKPPKLNKFIELGFLESNDSQVTTTCQPLDNHENNPCPQVDAPEESRVEKSRDRAETDNAPSSLDYSKMLMSVNEIEEVKRIKQKNSGSKKLSEITQRMINGLSKEFKLARDKGFTNDDILTEWENRGWKSFKAEWVKESSTNDNNSEFEGFSQITQKNIKNLQGDW